MSDQPDSMRLPSRHQIGDTVRCDDGEHAVSGVMFTPSKVFYDVDGALRPSDDVSPNA
jgi:hypothetical protein